MEVHLLGHLQNYCKLSFSFLKHYLNFKFGICQKQTKNIIGNYNTAAKICRILLNHTEWQTMPSNWIFMSALWSRRKITVKWYISSEIYFILIKSPQNWLDEITWKHWQYVFSPQSNVENFHIGPSNMSLSNRPCLTD